MAYIDVASWSPEHVVYYIRGMHSSLDKLSMEQFIKKRVNGVKFMLLTAQDLVELIPNICVDALYKLLRGIQLLNYFSHNSNNETLQSLTLALATQARNLHNQLCLAEKSPRLLPVSDASMTPMLASSTKNRFDFVKVNSNIQLNQSTKQRVSLETLQYVSSIVEYIMKIVDWLNTIKSAPEEPKFNKDFKSILLRVAVELSSTAQRDQFVDYPNDLIKKTSKFFADYCEWVVLAILDADFIQPCRLDLVSIKKKLGETDFGLVIESRSIDSIHIVEVKFSSAAHRSGRVSVRDEIVQVDYETVIGWPVEKVRSLIDRESKNEIILTLKKKPSQSTLNSSVTVLKAYPIPKKKLFTHQISNSMMSQDNHHHIHDNSNEKRSKDLNNNNNNDENTPDDHKINEVSDLIKRTTIHQTTSANLKISMRPEDNNIDENNDSSNINNDNNDTPIGPRIELSHELANSDNEECLPNGRDNDNDDDHNRGLNRDSNSTNELLHMMAPPKEPKGPVYELELPRDRRDLKRRVSISGSIPDALVDLSIGDVLPALTNKKLHDPLNNCPGLERSSTSRSIKEPLTKSVSHETAKMYLHTLSIDRKHLWASQLRDRDLAP